MRATPARFTSMAPAVWTGTKSRSSNRFLLALREHRNSRIADLHAARKCSTGPTTRAAQLVRPLRRIGLVDHLAREGGQLRAAIIPCPDVPFPKRCPAGN